MPPVGPFDGQRAAVTGAGGFIGGAVCAALAARGARVVGIDVSPELTPAAREAGAEPTVADVTDRAAMEAALAGADLVVHAAAFVRDWGTMADFVAVNARGSAMVLDAAEAAGAKRCVQISSVVVYGYDDPSEQGEERFRRAYGIPYIDTKAASDRLACRRGAVVIRPGDVYGPGSMPWIVRPLELARAGRLAVPSPGDGVMLPVYIDDLVEAVLLGLEKGKPGHAYAAWDGSPVSFRDYFDRIAEIAGGPPCRVLPAPLLEAFGAAAEAFARLRGQPPMFSARAATFVARRGTVSTERIRRELGWEPTVGLDDGLARSADWARAQGLV
jgi:nucleoside-diphosphate-sugar epimerase